MIVCRDVDLPEIDSVYVNDGKLLFEQVHGKGVQIPQNKKQGRVLDIAPTGRLHQLTRPQPVNEHPHGNDEKNMSQLMGIKTFGCAVGLGGKGRFGDDQNRTDQPEESNGFDGVHRHCPSQLEFTPLIFLLALAVSRASGLQG